MAHTPDVIKESLNRLTSKSDMITPVEVAERIQIPGVPVMTRRQNMVLQVMLQERSRPSPVLMTSLRLLTSLTSQITMH